MLLGGSIYQIHRFKAPPLAQFSRVVSAQSNSLPPLGTFDVWSSVWNPKSTRISSFVATKAGLYVLVHHLGAGGEVIHLDQDGRVLDNIQVPQLHGLGPATSLSADDIGNVAMLHGKRSARTVLALDSTNSVILDAPLPRRFENIVVVQGKVFGISESVAGYVDLVSATGGETVAQIPREVSAPMILFPVGKGQLGVIDQVKAIYYQVDLPTHSVRANPLLSPEIRKAMDFARQVSSEDGKVVGSVISGAACDENGDIFATISPYSDDDISVLRISAAAKTISHFDLTLPSFPELRGKPMEGGYIVPSQIAVMGDRLFLLSQPQFKVAYYQIPN